MRCVCNCSMTAPCFILLIHDTYTYYGITFPLSEQGGLNGAHSAFVVAISPFMVDTIVSISNGLDLSRWHIFFVDEKLDSNFHNARDERDELLAKLPIRPAQVYSASPESTVGHPEIEIGQNTTFRARFDLYG